MRKRTSAEDSVLGPPLPYQAALDELGVTVRQALALAEVLDYFAAIFRGKPPDPEGPPVDAFPTPSEIRGARTAGSARSRRRNGNGTVCRWTCASAGHGRVSCWRVISP
jgi:hypothetical protein